MLVFLQSQTPLTLIYLGIEEQGIQFYNSHVKITSHV